MKKLLAAVLTAALTVGMLVGCGGSDSATAALQNPVRAALRRQKLLMSILQTRSMHLALTNHSRNFWSRVNAFIAKIQEDGTLDEIFDKYFGGGEPTPVESAALDESKDQLVVATNAAFEPFEYMEGENYVWY